MVEVLLGMPGPWADEISEASNHYSTKIGGLPDWPPSMRSFRRELLDCNACGSKLCLIAQVYAPILSVPSKMEERTIYIFCCTTPECGSSPPCWKVLRIQNLCEEEKSSPTQELVPSTAASLSNSKTDWRDNLWSMDSAEEENGANENCFDLMDLGRALSDATNLYSHSKKNNTSQQAENILEAVALCQESCALNLNMPVVPCFYIYTQEESSKSPCLEHSSVSLEQNDDDADMETWDEECYEYDRALNADRMYLKFKKQVDACPQQCFRYSYGGKPVLGGGEAVGEAGKCKLCGAWRKFEMQLMPSLLYFLHEAAEETQKHWVHNWDWISVLVYTCSQNCFKAVEEGKWTVAEEAVVIQSERADMIHSKLIFSS